MTLKKTLIIIFVLSLVSLKAQHKKVLPNAVLIVADDLGYECINSYGGSSYSTPILTQLSETGIQFETVILNPYAPHLE